jgi:hypothetical protein
MVAHKGEGNMGGLTREERLQIILTATALEALDTSRFSRRIPSPAAAVRELLKRGLAAEGFDVADGGMKSRDFSVTGGRRGRSSKADGNGRGDSNGSGSRARE